VKITNVRPEKSLGQRKGPGRAQKRCCNRKTRRINCTTRELNAGSREKEKEKRGWRIASKGLLWELSFAALPASHGQQQRTPSPRPRLCPQYLSLLELERRAFPTKGTYIVFSFALSSLLPFPACPFRHQHCPSRLSTEEPRRAAALDCKPSVVFSPSSDIGHCRKKKILIHRTPPPTAPFPFLNPLCPPPSTRPLTICPLLSFRISSLGLRPQSTLPARKNLLRPLRTVFVPSLLASSTSVLTPISQPSNSSLHRSPMVCFFFRQIASIDL
jgi:hypothetical protein